MDNEVILILTYQWQQICVRYSEKVLEDAICFMEQYSSLLVDEFYKQIIQEKEALEFFADDIISQRLKKTLNSWLLDNVNVITEKNFSDLVIRQQTVGHVHARIGIPPWLIIRGIREIERKIFSLLQQDTHYDAIYLLDYLNEMISFSTEIMCRSYEVDSLKHHESKNSYRLFSAMQDIAVQKDRQRSILLDWENDLMYKALSGASDLEQILLSKSEFGLWFTHKAAYAFSGSDQVGIIIQLIQQVDQLLENLLKSHDRTLIQQHIQAIRQKNREIQHLVNQLFQVSDYIDMGNDALTQLLSRRYLDTVILRETQFSRKNKTPLSLLAIDADHFKKINDQYGHASGDVALKTLAEILTQNSRGSDYAFRIGGEEFLLLLIDTDLHEAKKIAERIRKEIEDATVHGTQDTQFKFTVSIGVKSYDGHPDYQRFLESVDQALYAAKNNGRNQVQN